MQISCDFLGEVEVNEDRFKTKRCYMSRNPRHGKRKTAQNDPVGTMPTRDRSRTSMNQESDVFFSRFASSIRVRAVHSGSLANGECPYSALITLSTMCGPLFVIESIIHSAVCTVLALSLVHRMYVEGI